MTSNSPSRCSRHAALVGSAFTLMSGSARALYVYDRQSTRRRFYLDEMFDLRSLLASDRYSEHDRESIAAILDLCQNMAEEEFLPCAGEHDENEPVFKDGKAITPDSLKACLKTFVEAGLPTATFDHDLGGMQFPRHGGQLYAGYFSGGQCTCYWLPIPDILQCPHVAGLR